MDLLWLCIEPQMFGYWCFNKDAGLQLNLVSKDTTKLGLMLQAKFYKHCKRIFQVVYEIYVTLNEKTTHIVLDINQR